jgi:hypothetical protein
MPRYAGADLLQKFATYDNILASAETDSAASRPPVSEAQPQPAPPPHAGGSPASSCASGGAEGGAARPESRPSSAGSSHLPEEGLLLPPQLLQQQGKPLQQQLPAKAPGPQPAGQGRPRRASSPEIRTPARQPSALGSARSNQLRASSEDEREVAQPLAQPQQQAQQQAEAEAKQAQQQAQQEQLAVDASSSFQNPIFNATPDLTPEGTPRCETAKQLFSAGASALSPPAPGQWDVEQQGPEQPGEQLPEQRRRSGLMSRTLSSITGFVRKIKPGGEPAAGGSPGGSDGSRPLPQLFGRRQSQGRGVASSWPEFGDEEAGALPSVAPLAGGEGEQQREAGWGPLWQFAAQEQGDQAMWRFARHSLAASSEGSGQGQEQQEEQEGQAEQHGPGAWGAAPVQAAAQVQGAAQEQEEAPDAALVQLGRQYVLRQHQRDLIRHQQLQEEEQLLQQHQHQAGARPGSDQLAGYGRAAAEASSSPGLAARGRSEGGSEAADSEDELCEVLQLPSGSPPPGWACHCR